MPPTSSFWLASAPGETARPALSGTRQCDVAVIGGGIVGASVARLLAADGVDVVLLESDTIASGTTGHTSAKVTSAHGLIYHRLADKHGAEAAASYAAMNESGIAAADSLRQDLGIECGWRRRDAFTYVIHPSQRAKVEAEAAAASEAGLDADVVDEPGWPFPAAAAVRVTGQAEFQPVEWVRGVARGAEAAGATIFEHSRVLEVSVRRPYSLRTESGTVEADRVIVASHYPTLDRGLFFARLEAQRSYVIALEASGEPPAGMFISADGPTRSLRSHRAADGSETLIVGGDGHPTGDDENSSRHFGALESWAQEHLAAGTVTHRWSAQDPMPPDLLPYVGSLLPFGEGILVATGFGKWGLAAGVAAAGILADRIHGRDNPYAELVASNRVDPVAAGPTLAKRNMKVGRHLVGGRLTATAETEALQPGEGAIVRSGVHRVAAYRDDEGALHQLRSACTHLGCEVRFNDAERSWDCPCHGSRFDAVDGRVLEGPAVHPLRLADR